MKLRFASLASWGSPGLIVLILFVYGVGFLWFIPHLAAVLMVLALAGFVWLGTLFFRVGMAGDGGFRFFRFFSGSAVVLVFLAAYYFNSSYRWDGGAIPIEHIQGLPASAYSLGTSKAFFFAVLGLAVLGLSMNLQHRGLNVAVHAVLAMALVIAIMLLNQRLEFSRSLSFRLTGLFAYENHFAAFANLIFPVTLTCGARQRCRSFQEGKTSSPFLLYYGISALLLAAIVLSRSRAGVVVASLTLGLFFLRKLWVYRRHPFAVPAMPLPIRIGAGLGVVAGAGILFKAVCMLGFDRILANLSFRFQTVSDTFSIWNAYPVWGTGPGSFSAVFPYYQTLSVEKYYFSHAHCEPIEFLAEYGLLGGGILLVALLWIVWPQRGSVVQDQPVPSFWELEGFGFGLALAGICLHSLIDFPFRHPLNALVSIIWIGILAGQLSAGGLFAPRQEEPQ